MRRLLVLAAAFAGLLGAARAAGDGPSGPRFSAESAAETVIFDWTRDRCSRTDIPDAPARAFRDFRGTIHLIATHEDNRAFVGPDFDHLSHPCEVIYRGDHLDDPARFNDRQWLTSFHTEDGKTIFALVHNEFQGNLRPAMCPSRKYLSCWYNSITAAVSSDGGATFRHLEPPGNVIAAPSVPYQPDVGRPIGYFQPTNIVEKDGFSYFMFLATKAGVQAEGKCVVRSDRPEDPTSWRAFDGTGFNVRLTGPYLAAPGTPPPVCATVGKGQLFELGSLAFDRVSGKFVYLGAVSVGAGDRAHPRGAYVSTSPDLLHWSPPQQVFKNPPEGDGPGENFRYGLFSLVDEGSTARDFSEISSYDNLYLYYVKFDLRNRPYSRVLAKKKVAFISQNP